MNTRVTCIRMNCDAFAGWQARAFELGAKVTVGRPREFGAVDHVVRYNGEKGMFTLYPHRGSFAEVPTGIATLLRQTGVGLV